MKKTSLLHAIGSTPLVTVNFGTPPTILAKLEYLNPGGSIKDRSALFMIEEAEQKGLLQPGGVLIEASSGNQGIATAMVGAAKGYKVIITVTDKCSAEKINTIKAYGAEVRAYPVTESLTDPENYHQKALALHLQTPNSFFLNQYFSTSNSDAHYASLGPEIWQQTEGKITHFFAGAGSCGTVTGVARYLKQQNKNITIVACDAATSYRSTNGNPSQYSLEGIGVDYAAPLLDLYGNLIDEFIGVTDDHGMTMLQTMARKHGILCGPSSGAVAYAVQEYTKKLSAHDTVVMIMGDSGRAYLSKGYYF